MSCDAELDGADGDELMQKDMCGKACAERRYIESDDEYILKMSRSLHKKYISRFRYLANPSPVDFTN